MGGDSKPTGPDLKAGIPLSDLADGAMVQGHADGEAVVMARIGGELLAIGATCTHYGGPLAEGLLVGDTVRCPWHHACFSFRTGEALRAPAFSPLSCWRVEESAGRAYVREKIEPGERRLPPTQRPAKAPTAPIVIIGGGAAGFAAAEMLRRDGFGGGITMLSEDEAAPYDRPNLSKDYLAGTAPEEWIPLRPDEFYRENGIDLVLGAAAAEIDTSARQVKAADGRLFSFDKLLIATGAEPVRLNLPGADLPQVRVLRSLRDSRELIARAKEARRVAVIGASFIGLEVAAALRQRELDVHVIAPEQRPMERVLGPELGQFIRDLHEAHGVRFHLGHGVKAVEAQRVFLDDGSAVDADLVVVGVGVRPRLALAERAGLKIDRGILVNEYLETSVPGIFAAGDVARWPDPITGERLRIEHWVVAERQGQTAARNMLGRRERFASAPFFWSQHYDIAIDYVGHAERWDKIEVEGDIAGHDARLRFRRDDRTLAVATIFRGRQSLEAEVAMEASAKGSS
jgi:NADPH-dependent 2,4-dienoyl-CoA reductase/sulfur reductase-like enzyme/nitrite reductase/ring-hydroxylating ferredoxin subunit